MKKLSLTVLAAVLCLASMATDPSVTYVSNRVITSTGYTCTYHYSLNGSTPTSLDFMWDLNKYGSDTSANGVTVQGSYKIQSPSYFDDSITIAYQNADTTYLPGTFYYSTVWIAQDGNVETLLAIDSFLVPYPAGIAANMDESSSVWLTERTIRYANLPANSTMTIADMAGRTVATAELSAPQGEISAAGFRPGTYIVQCLSKEGERLVLRKIVIGS